LVFFASLQSTQLKHHSYTAEDLVNNVLDKFNAYDGDKLNRVWISMMACMNAIRQCQYGNDYKLPHLRKTYLEARGELPDTLSVAPFPVPNDVVPNPGQVLVDGA